MVSPPNIPNYISGTSSVEAMDSLFSSRHDLLRSLHKKLEKAQQQMKTQADTHRRAVNYSVGDWVYVRLHPRQTSATGVQYSKLGKRYYGPYQITEVIGSVAYRLDLPATTKVHPVFTIPYSNLTMVLLFRSKMFQLCC